MTETDEDREKDSYLEQGDKQHPQESAPASASLSSACYIIHPERQREVERENRESVCMWLTRSRVTSSTNRGVFQPLPHCPQLADTFRHLGIHGD